MRNTSRFVLGTTFTLSLTLTACGGKIAADDRSSPGSDPGSGFDPTPAPSGTQQASPPFATFPPPSSGVAQPSGTPSVDDACGAICERNGECGATQTDCKDSCADEIRGASSCSAQANAYILCYASNLVPGCAALPPVCESAYCAYTICAGKVVPRYCH